MTRERKEHIMKNKTSLTMLCNILCIVLMLVLLGLQLLPFWTLEGDTISIQEYTWFPTDNTALTDHFEDIISKDFMVKDICLMPVVVILGAVITAYVCLTNLKKPAAIIAPLACALVAVYGYLFVPIFQMGQLWKVHLGVAIGLLVACVIPVIQCILHIIEWFNPKD